MKKDYTSRKVMLRKVLTFVKVQSLISITVRASQSTNLTDSHNVIYKFPVTSNKI